MTYPLSKTTKGEVFSEVPDSLISYSCERPDLSTFVVKGHYILNIENCCNCCYCRENEHVFKHFDKRILVDIPDECAESSSIQRLELLEKSDKDEEIYSTENCLKESD